MRPGKADLPAKPVSWLRAEGLALLVLALSFLFCFRAFITRFFSEVFLSLDMTVIYYPLFHWVHDHLAQGRLPLISDLAYHGAPVAAVSMVGVLSPFLWLFHVVSSFTPAFNLLFLFPTACYLVGTYFLGRRLGLSKTACLLLAFLWAFNGHQMAQLDHLNVAWAHAFFPWAFLCLLNYMESRKFLWILLSSLGLALNLLSGHPQVVFLECLFFLFWALVWNSYSLKDRLKAVAILGFGAFLFASPLILFTLECHWPDGLGIHWSPVDRFYHSWTPVNFITLLFPWFFGHIQYDRSLGDYWWQYQFVEMQVAFSIAGLFFILLFFLKKNPQRRFIAVTGLFAVLMAFGKFFFFYPLVQSLPVFSFFRDPARYWFLATWVLGLGAAYAWEEWFSNEKAVTTGRKLAVVLAGTALGLLALGWLVLFPGRHLVEKMAAWAIQHFLLGDGIHTQPLSAYLARLPEKLNALAFNLDPRHLRVLFPLLFLGALLACVFNRKKWNIYRQKSILLLLVFADLMFFRMPFGDAFYDPSKIPQPSYPAPQNRSLVLLSQDTSPLPAQYGEMSHPNWNFISGRPNLMIDANPGLASYDNLAAALGWFSWVYKARDSQGFVRHAETLQLLGIDQIVSDIALNLPKTFITLQDRYPFVYSILKVAPKAYLADFSHQFSFSFDPNRLEKWNAEFPCVIFELKPDFLNFDSEKDPFSKQKLLLMQLTNSSNGEPIFHSFSPPQINKFNETSLSISAHLDKFAYLVIQKTFLPGWKSAVNNKPSMLLKCNYVLTAIPLLPGKNQVELKFEPTGLRLGFFLFFLFSGVLVFFLVRSRHPSIAIES
jgi:hypothetical protein